MANCLLQNAILPQIYIKSTHFPYILVEYCNKYLSFSSGGKMGSCVGSNGRKARGSKRETAAKMMDDVKSELFSIDA